jgi:hypothetical protein
VWALLGLLAGQARWNLAIANGDDGIYAAQGGVDEFGPIVVSRNTAAFNTDLGIDTWGAGVIDGGGNRAFGNGNPAQCANVTCRGRANPGR